MNLDTDLTTFTNINSKSIRHLSVKCKTKKQLQNNLGGNLDDLGYGTYFLNTTSKALIHKVLDNLDFIKMKDFLCERQW